MEIDGIGLLTSKDDGTYESAPIPLAVLGGKPCRIVLEKLDREAIPRDFQTAAKSFLSLNQSTLTEAAPHVFQYYRDTARYLAQEPNFPKIGSAEGVWKHVQFGDTARVKRRAYGDKKVYISLECQCNWEPEHGLQIVFKEGKRINKIGPYNGHLTNSDAYDDESLEEVIYPKTGE